MSVRQLQEKFERLVGSRRVALIIVLVDQWGYACGGETANYGDFLDSVTQTNSTVYQQLILQQLRIERVPGRALA